MKVAHLTSVHSRYDTRIFLKMCSSLARHGFDVALVVADGKGNETIDGIRIYDVEGSRNRFFRMIAATTRVLKQAIKLDADIYHLHDPELIPIGLKLVKRCKKVIFDSHEDVPEQIINKPYLFSPINKIIAASYKFFQKLTCRQLNAIVTPTSHITNQFRKINPITVEVKNYPIINEFAMSSESNEHWNKNKVCYIGTLTLDRGLKELILALGYLKNDVRLELGGIFYENSFKQDLMIMPGWSSVSFHGQVGREEIRSVYNDCLAGLVVLHPKSNYVDALPVKMFEYMSAGLPVIASDFPLWKEIIEGHQCGICVNPMDPKAIAAAIDYLAENPELALEMGKRGRKAVEEKYNWATEEVKLISLYKNLLGSVE